MSMIDGVYDDGVPEDDCDHLDYDLDILTGHATCVTCDRRWHMTAAELERHHELAAMPYPGEDEEPEAEVCDTCGEVRDFLDGCSCTANEDYEP